MEIKVCVHLDPATLKALGGQLGQQILMRRSAERLAPLTVTAENGFAGTALCPGAVTVEPEGMARLAAAPLPARLRRRFSRA